MSDKIYIVGGSDFRSDGNTIVRVEFNPPLERSKGEGYELNLTIEDNGELTATTKRIRHWDVRVKSAFPNW